MRFISVVILRIYRALGADFQLRSVIAFIRLTRVAHSPNFSIFRVVGGKLRAP